MTHLICCAMMMVLAAFAEPTGITVNVTVRTEANGPLEGVFLVILASPDAAFGFTDENGMLSRTVTPDSTTDELHVFLRDAARLNVSPSEAVQAYERYESLRSQYHFQSSYPVTVVPEMAQANIDIVARPAIKVTGKVVSPIPQWELDSVIVLVRDGIWSGRFEPLEPFEVRGVRKGEPAELLFILYRESAIRSIRLTAEQTEADVDLGDITFPAISAGAVVDVEMTNADDLWEPGGIAPLWRHMTLISTNGETILTYEVDPATHKAVATLATVEPYEPPSIPPGTYYVSPGLFAGATQLKLLDMVRANAHDLLLAAGVPTINAQLGNNNALTFDATQARNGIAAAHVIWSGP